MTEASKGLGNALARTGSKVLAIGEMSAADILASMSDGQKADLLAAARAAHPEPDSAEPDGDDDDSKCSKCKEPMKDGKCSKCSAGASAADPALAARAEERARFAAVMSSEHYKGRESLAATLLASDKLSADEILAALAASGTAGSNASDDAARAEMRAALSASQNSNIDAGNGGENASTPNYAAGWAKATSDVNRRNGFN